MYAGEGQLDAASVLGNVRGSEDFDGFVRALGWMVNIETHLGYSGKLQAPLGGTQYPYIGRFGREVVFHVATLLSNHVASGARDVCFNRSSVFVLILSYIIPARSLLSKGRNTSGG